MRNFNGEENCEPITLLYNKTTGTLTDNNGLYAFSGTTGIDYSDVTDNSINKDTVVVNNVSNGLRVDHAVRLKEAGFSFEEIKELIG